MVGLLGACSPAGPTAGPTPATSSAAVPQPTRWPGNAVLSAIAIAGADGQFEVVGKDLNAALAASDNQGLLTVTSDFLTFLEEVQAKIPALQAYGGTKEVGDKLAASYGGMIAGIRQIHDALIAGNGAGVTAGFEAFGTASSAYAQLRPALAELATAALAQQRLIVR